MGNDSGAIGSLNVLRIQSDTYFALEKNVQHVVLTLRDFQPWNSIKDIASEEASLQEVRKEFATQIYGSKKQWK